MITAVDRYATLKTQRWFRIGLLVLGALQEAITTTVNGRLRLQSHEDIRL